MASAMALPAFLERARLAKHQASLEEAGYADSTDLAEATDEELAECGLKRPELKRLRRTLALRNSAFSTRRPVTLGEPSSRLSIRFSTTNNNVRLGSLHQHIH